MKIDIEKAARIYFEKELSNLIEKNLYFGFDDFLKGSLILESIFTFQKKYFGNKYPYGHSLLESSDDVVLFKIHFNYKGSVKHIIITMYPKLIQRKMKINKLLKNETED